MFNMRGIGQPLYIVVMELRFMFFRVKVLLNYEGILFLFLKSSYELRLKQSTPPFKQEFPIRITLRLSD